jgi:hypothetical protein
MNFKTTYILFGVLVGMLGLFLVTQLRGKKTVDTNDYVLPSLQAGKITAQDITGVDIERLRPEGSKLVFARTPHGWELEHPKTRADSSHIDQLINQVMRASREESADMTAGPASYGLDAPSAIVTLHMGSEKEWKLSLGNARLGKDDPVVYVTSSDRPNEPMAVRRNQLESIVKEVDSKGNVQLKDTKDFRSKSLLAESAFDINSVQFEEPKKETVALEKTADSKWRFDKPAFGEADYEGETAPAGGTPETKPITGVRDLLQAVADLRVDSDDDFGATDVSDKDLADKGLEKGKEMLRIELKRQPGFAAAGEEKKEPVKAVLLIGKKADDKGDKFYARPEDERNIVKVSAKKVEAITKVLENPSLLRNRDLVQADATKVDAVNLQSTAPIKLRKSGEPAEWKIYESGKPPEKADDAAVQEVVNALTAKRIIKDFPDPKKTDADLGLDKPSAVVSLWQDGIKKEEKKEDKKEEKPGETKDDKKADAKSGEQKSDKKNADGEPPLKDGKPAVKITFGKREKDLVYVKREASNDVTRAAVSVSLFDKAAESKLAFLDRKIPFIGATRDVSKIALARGNENYEIDRGKDETWALKQPANLAGRSVDAGKVSGLLGELHNLRAEKLLTQKATDKELDRYGLKVPSAKVTITETKADKKPPEQSSSLLIGKETEDKSSVFAKLGNRDTVFLLRKGVLDAVQGDLRDPTVLKFDINKVKTVKIAGWQDVVGSPFILDLERRTSQDWAVKNPNFVLNSAQVETFVSGLANLRAERFIGMKSGAKPEYKLDLKDGAMDIVITVEGEKDPIMLSVGGSAGADGYYAKTNKLPDEIFVVAKGAFEKAKSKPAYFKKEQ